MDTRLNQSICIISGTIKSSPLNWLLVLSSISPPQLRWKTALLKLWSKLSYNTTLPIHEYSKFCNDLYFALNVYELNLKFCIKNHLTFTSSSLTKSIKASFCEILSSNYFGYSSFSNFQNIISISLTSSYFVNTFLYSLLMHKKFWKSLDRFSQTTASLYNYSYFSPSFVPSLSYNSLCFLSFSFTTLCFFSQTFSVYLVFSLPAF